MDNIVRDLFDLKNRQINELQEKLYIAQNRITQLETYIFELCDNDCPKEYKHVVKQEVFQYKSQHDG